MTPTHERVGALAPTPQPLDTEGSTTALARIVEQQPRVPRAVPWWRRTRRRVVALVASGVVLLSAGTAVAVGGPAQVVKDALLDFSRQPNTTANGMGRLDDPLLVAKFRVPAGIFAVWVATSSSGTVCTAYSDATWDGTGDPTRGQLEFGCGGVVLSNLGQPEELTRPDQLGGFFKDTDGPIVYGVSPYPDAVEVHVQGAGVDRVLLLRTDSHGFGAALPEATGAASLTLTFLDASGAALGSRQQVAPVG